MMKQPFYRNKVLMLLYLALIANSLLIVYFLFQVFMLWADFKPVSNMLALEMFASITLSTFLWMGTAKAKEYGQKIFDAKMKEIYR